MPAFACGIVLYYLYRKGLRLHWVGAIVLLFCSTSMMALIKNDKGYWFAVCGKTVLFTNLTLFCFALLGFAAAIVLSPNIPINNRVARYVGEVSYSLYLIHFLWIPCVVLALRVVGLKATGDAGFIGFTILTIVTGTAAATVTYRLVEKPAIAWAKQISDRKKQVSNPSDDRFRDVGPGFDSSQCDERENDSRPC